MHARWPGVRNACVLFALALPISVGLACGPDFPQNLLDDRRASLMELPEGTFDYEASHLLPKPTDRLHAGESSPWDDAEEVRSKAEAVGLSSQEIAKVKAMRAGDANDAAIAAGAGLAPELLDYTLGAIAFKAGRMTEAANHFRDVLKLPAPERPRRGLWAQYMLARALLASNDTSGALAAFAVVRERANSGVPDQLGLAVASLGEQARVQWHHGNVAGAVASYALQAAHGSASGRASLLFVARSILSNEVLLDKALNDPLSQHLLAAYFFTRSGEMSGSSNSYNGDDGAGGDTADASAPTIHLDTFLAHVERHGIDHFKGADLLAAGAYRNGRYELATRLAALSNAPMAAWVRAKLALRAGDQKAADLAYAQAARWFAPETTWSTDTDTNTEGDSVIYGNPALKPQHRVRAEQGILALSRADYLEAMRQLWYGASWSDAAYIAERVLSVGELKGFVDANVAKTTARKPANAEDYVAPQPATLLRALLGRRLLRVGRSKEALGYFDDPAVHAKALAYVDKRGKLDTWTQNAHAKALFELAIATRQDGMLLLASELAPDFAIYDGSYALDDAVVAAPEYTSTGEVARVKANAIKPGLRYHYRDIAAGLGEQAAALLPPRSQAYAAVLCKAASWVIDNDPKFAARLYNRYLREGAHVKWGGAFGRDCPAPDFKAAQTMVWQQRWLRVRHWIRHAWPFEAGGLALLIGLLLWRRQRKMSLA
ncbi:MAG: hypothetical protein ABIQ97_00435 [Lysobacteraceae bacterium]